MDSSTCPPEGGRYIDQNLVLTQTLKPGLPRRVKILRGASGAALDEFEDWRYSSSVREGDL